MRLSSTETNKIKIQIMKISDDTVEGKHISSNVVVKALITKKMDLEIGQVVLLEFKRNENGGQYIVRDALMEEIDADVLDAQHIISDGVMYTSIIIQNPSTRKRMHSLVPSSNKLFCSTSVIITGDKVKVRINNGSLFSINY